MATTARLTDGQRREVASQIGSFRRPSGLETSLRATGLFESLPLHVMDVEVREGRLVLEDPEGLESFESPAEWHHQIFTVENARRGAASGFAWSTIEGGQVEVHTVTHSRIADAIDQSLRRIDTETERNPDVFLLRVPSLHLICLVARDDAGTEIEIVHGPPQVRAHFADGQETRARMSWERWLKRVATAPLVSGLVEG